MQRDALDLFEEENKYAIEKIIHHIKSKHKYYDGSFFSEMKPFTNLMDNHGRKKFIYLCASLLKNDVDYIEVYKLGLNHINNLMPVRLIDDDLTGEQLQYIDKDTRSTREIQLNSIQHLRFAPLIAYSICSYDEIHLWIASHRNDKNNRYIQIIERFELLDQLIELDNKLDEECNDDNVTDITKRRDEALKLINQHLKCDPELSDRSQLYTSIVSLNSIELKRNIPTKHQITAFATLFNAQTPKQQQVIIEKKGDLLQKEGVIADFST